LRNLSTSVRRLRRCDLLIAGLRRCASRKGQEKQKGPDPFGFRTSACRDSKVRGYALPSPGCIRSPLRPSCLTCQEAKLVMAGQARCHVAPQVPSDPTAAACANPTRPFMGRMVLTAWREFTMGSLDGQRSPGAVWCPKRRTVNSLYAIVKPLREWRTETLHGTRQTVANTTVTRRLNALALFQAYAEKALAAGASPKGLEQAFAATLEISPSMWSQIKSSRPIGDKLARQIEQHQGKPTGWLDDTRKDAPPTAAEKALMALALAAWRSTNSTGRKALRMHLELIVKSRV
jgi:hypothetical protein